MRLRGVRGPDPRARALSDSAPELPPDFPDDGPEEPSLEELRDNAPRCTDAGNADAVVAKHGRGYRYVAEWESWIAWDGRRWARIGAKQRVRNAALLTARESHYATRGRLRALEKRRADLLRDGGKKDEDLEEDIKRELKLLKWHEQSQNASKIDAAVKVLESRQQVTLAELDADPWLLNVANGTLDLRNAELRPHDPADLITQIADVEWDDNAACPTWDSFVSGAMGGDLQLVLYLQRWVGYALTALTTEHALVFFYGGGRNGKSTFINTVRTMLGEYACAAPRDLLFEKKNNSHPTELARLYGKRLAICAEIAEHMVLDEAKVKDLTGGDAVAARRMNENFWDMIPTHKLGMAGNHKPTVRGDDLGIWRRVRLVPWTVTIEEANVDKDLPAKLRAEMSGILRWAVNGTSEWVRLGLAEPEVIRKATQAYREENDALGRFFTTYAVFGKDESIPRQTLRIRYEAWCEEIGYKPVGAKKLAQKLRDLGVTETTVRDMGLVKDGWRGCRLRSDHEMQVGTPLDRNPKAAEGTA